MIKTPYVLVALAWITIVVIMAVGALFLQPRKVVKGEVNISIPGKHCLYRLDQNLNSMSGGTCSKLRYFDSETSKYIFIEDAGIKSFAIRGQQKIGKDIVLVEPVIKSKLEVIIFYIVGFVILATTIIVWLFRLRRGF